LIYNEGFKDVYVFTGPAYLPKRDENDKKYYVKYEVIGNIAVPTHFYKVILAVKDDLSALGTFLMPNQRIIGSTPLEVFRIELDDLERLTGLSFFDQPTKDSSVYLCSENASKCILVANPKHVEEELRTALPKPNNETSNKS
jgi:endonuclease G, mitochondrial